MDSLGTMATALTGQKWAPPPLREKGASTPPVTDNNYSSGSLRKDEKYGLSDPLY